MIHLPASLRAVVDITEKRSAPDGTSRPWVRASQHEVTIDVERDDVGPDDARAVVAAVSIRRVSGTPVTGAVLRDVQLGELVDWMLTRAPVAETADGDYLGAGHPAAAEALRAVRPKTGKREREISPRQVADVVGRAPRRGQGAALRAAFPGVGRRTLQRLLAEARDAGLTPHTARSRHPG